MENTLMQVACPHGTDLRNGVAGYEEVAVPDTRLVTTALREASPRVRAGLRP
jgi:hypothetical protein